VVATDALKHRLEAALKFGADAAFYAEDDVPRRVRKLNDGRLTDLVIVCTGAKEAIAQALQCVDRAGTVLFFAPTLPGVTLPLSINDIFWRNDVSLTTSYAGSPADHVAALELIRARTVRVEEMITHRLSLAQAGLGFDMVTHPERHNSLKVIIEPQR